MLADLSHDMHVHSTFSDGKGTIAENVDAARARHLRTICLVDHVRADTEWVPEFVRATEQLRRLELEQEQEQEQARSEGWGHPMAILCGVETKILNRRGDLDLPADLSGLDHVLVADHQFPLDDGPHNPKAILALRQRGVWADQELLENLVEATGNSLGAVAGFGILAHLFSVLPKAGLNEDDVSPAALDWLAARCAEHSVQVEVNERWGCPSPRTLSHLVRHGVGLVCSTDSHRVETIGVYDRVRSTLQALEDRHQPA